MKGPDYPKALFVAHLEAYGLLRKGCLLVHRPRLFLPVNTVMAGVSASSVKSYPPKQPSSPLLFEVVEPDSMSLTVELNMLALRHDAHTSIVLSAVKRSSWVLTVLDRQIR